MNPLTVLIVSERAPLDPDQPASGLTVRHTRMAEALAAQGLAVTYAWPGGDDDDAARPSEGAAFRRLPVTDRSDLAGWLRAQPGRVVVVLGYWELGDWLPPVLSVPLVLDYVAPRLLEQQFADRDRLGAEIERLLPVLARCDQVWVGNARQADLMLPWLLMAGHDLRQASPVSVVPIAGRPLVDEAEPEPEPEPSESAPDPLTVFHGGRDWPWRQSRRWLDAFPVRSEADSDARWRLIDATEQGGFGSYGDYIEKLSASQLALDLSDDNLERRFSQSFRMTDALCCGVPVLCNRFLPLAGLIEQSRAGWLVDAPDQLPGLLDAIAADPDELQRRGRNALALARERFDAAAIYGQLAEPLVRLADSDDRPAPRRPLALAATGQTGGGLRRSLGQYVRDWSARRLRRPFHNALRRALAGRPMPAPGRASWVVVSRSDLFPTDHGAAVKIERTAWGLSFHLDSVVLLTDRRDAYWVYRQGRRTEHRFPLLMRLPGWPRTINIIRLKARGLPSSEAFLYQPMVDRGLHVRLAWLLKRFPVETVQAEFPAFANPAVWAARLFGTRSLMVEHNVEFQRIADQQPDLPEAVRLKLKRYEVDLANACHDVITVSDRDRDRLIESGVRAPLICTIPHGVDLKRFETADPVDLRALYAIPADHAVLVYHGTFAYPPNLEAVEELSRKLLPKLAERGHPASVVAMGPMPPDFKLPGVRFTGPVDDLAGHLKGADLAVIPLRKGGGTRMKILDDFAAGVAVITTSKGIEGIPVVDRQHLRIVDNADAMAATTIELLENSDERARLASAARAWVADFDWREIARRYIERVRRD